MDAVIIKFGTVENHKSWATDGVLPSSSTFVDIAAVAVAVDCDDAFGVAPECLTSKTANWLRWATSNF